MPPLRKVKKSSQIKGKGKRIISSPITSEEDDIAPLSKKFRIFATTPSTISPVVDPQTQPNQTQSEKSKIILTNSEELGDESFVELVIVSDSESILVRAPIP